jgi:hypothetical protein
VKITSTPSADSVSVTGTSAAFALVLDATKPFGQAIYRLTSNVDLWWAQGSSPTASAGAGSAFLAAGDGALIEGRLGARVAVISDGVDGRASLCPVVDAP